MGLHPISEETRMELEKIAASAELYDEDDEILSTVDGNYMRDKETCKRVFATMARMALDGKLDPPWQKNDEIEKK